MRKDFLNTVLTVKKQEVMELQKRVNAFSQLFADPDRFVWIGEIKPKSPTLTEVKQHNFVEQAVKYGEGGVDAISVLTDHQFFGGSVNLLSDIRQKVTLPLLMKDFILDESQIIEGVKAGADSVLLIVDFLSSSQLARLIQFCRVLGVEPLVEIQDEKELDTALKAKALILGVNSRNLRTLEIDGERALRVVRTASQHLSTLFLSGIEQHEDVLRAQRAGARGVLIGSTLMKSADVGATIQQLKGEL